MIFCLRINLFLKRKSCPICKQNLTSKLGSKFICTNCETEWIFNSQTGVIKYAVCYGNRNNKSQQ